MPPLRRSPGRLPEKGTTFLQTFGLPFSGSPQFTALYGLNRLKPYWNHGTPFRLIPYWKRLFFVFAEEFCYRSSKPSFVFRILRKGPGGIGATDGTPFIRYGPESTWASAPPERSPALRILKDVVRLFSVLRHIGLRMPALLLVLLSVYFSLSAETFRLNQGITQTTRFSDSLSSLENVTNLYLLNTFSPKIVFPFPAVSYRQGLLIQGQAVLRTMQDNDSFLSTEDRLLLDKTRALFDRLRENFVNTMSVESLVREDRQLVLLFARLSGRSSESRILLLQKLLLLNFLRGSLLLAVLGGGGFFFFRKMGTFHKTSRQNRFYQAISRIDRLILSLPDIETLLSETCRIVVEEGGVSLARFIARNDDTPKGRLLAKFGHASKEFDRFNVSSDPSRPEGNGLWGTTIRSESPVIWNTIVENLEEEELRALYLQSGIASSAGFPVHRGGILFGALLVHSGEPFFFDPDLVELIGTLVENLSFAIDNRDRENERLRREREYTHLSLFDPLTNLPNRRLFQDRAGQAIERYRRGRETFVLGILDLDGFKQVNDRLGHPAGDRLLSLVSERLQGVLRATDTLARLGGDEFGLLLTALDKNGSADLFDRIIRSFSNPFSLGEETVTIGASLGATIVTPDDGDFEALLKHADIALYQVKEHGKNNWRTFSPDMAQSLEEHHRTQVELAVSLKENGFTYHYQPQAELRSGRIVGVEALLRWNHPERGLQEAGTFMQTLEDCETILEVERRGLDEILLQSRTWAKQGFSPRIRMNISCRNLLSGKFPDTLRTAFGRYPDVSPSILELDISDTKLFRDIRKVKAVVDTCRTIGVSLSLGNIGTEQSSLATMQTLGVDRITIPRSFVRNLGKSANDMAIIASLITSARLMLVDAIGEGIETEREGLLLLQWGCQVGQGIAISPPKPPDHIPEWVRSFRNYPSWSEWKAPPWGLTDYSLLMAKEAAHVFYANFLAGIEIPGESRPEWIDPHRCMQGRWIDGDGETIYGRTPEFHRYRKMHEHLHALVREALAARDNADRIRLDFLKEQIRKANKILIKQIERLQYMGVLGTVNNPPGSPPKDTARIP